MDTRGRILKEAETLMRTRGFASFTYSELAQEVEIRKASIYHYFPSKEALGLALVDEYLERFAIQLEEIAATEADAMAKLERYSGFFSASLIDHKLPLCGALAAETGALPESIRSRTKAFFRLHLDWLETIVRAGIGDGTLRKDLDAKNAAVQILNALEGASLVAWSLDEPDLVRSSFQSTLIHLQERLPPSLVA